MRIKEVDILKHRPVIVFLGALAVGIHLTLFALPENYTYVLLYIRCLCVYVTKISRSVMFVFRNQMIAWSLFLFLNILLNRDQMFAC